MHSRDDGSGDMERVRPPVAVDLHRTTDTIRVIHDEVCLTVRRRYGSASKVAFR
jgi:hypothetical protein